MRRIERLALEPATVTVLDELSNAVAAADPKDTKTVARRLWDSKKSIQERKVAFENIRSVLQEMARSRARCMYCEDSFGTDIEHFFPKADYPQKTFSWGNYLLACGYCNSNCKREKFPLLGDGSPALIDPTLDDPAEHLLFLPSDGSFRAIGPKGQPSIDIFGLNDTKSPRKLPQARRAVFWKSCLMLERYDDYSAAGDEESARFAKETIQDEPFLSVLRWLADMAMKPQAPAILPARIVNIVREHRVYEW